MAPDTQISQVGETRNSSRGSNASALKHDGSVESRLLCDRSGCWEICSLALGVDTMTLLTGRGGCELVRPRVPLGLVK
jgi:hypothetical protein